MNSNLKDAKILIVDDQLPNIELLDSLLTGYGYYNLKSTSDSRTVLELVKTFKPDILLLDLMMPHYSGFDIMDQLKAKGLLNSFMPILVLTADTSEEYRQKALSGGASDFLTKPFDLIEVELRIKNLLLTVYSLTQLKEHNIILEEKVKERTLELRLLNEELTKAKIKAEEINKLKSFFLANISHEFRTPLISILGFSEMLIEELKDAEQIESAKFIHESGKRLRKTLNDVISLTEIEKKKMEASFEKINLTKFVENISLDYKLQAENKGLTFTLINEQKEILLNTDERLLKEIIDNIVDNSVKFTKHGNIKILTSLQIENKNSNALISISDTGIGISPKNIENIFSPFRQESEGLNRSYEGLGLGLTVAKQLAERLKGELSIKSELGRGTTLTILLPLLMTEDELNDKIVRVKRVLSRSVKSREKGKPALLMVEDNKGNRTLFHKILSNDFEVDEAVDGITAVAMAEVKEYDIILMDINLGPGIDGIETFQRIRQIPNRQKVPVIAITAYAIREDRQKFLDYGFNDYLQKPVLRDEFLSLLKKHIFML